MVKPRGHFVGYKKFAVDASWVKSQQEYRELKARERFAQWSAKWITVTRLKKERLWTDGAIERFLGKPKKQGKYRVFAVEEVKRAEHSKAFMSWLAPRLANKLASDPYFVIKKIGTI